ncbi:MAG: hypothetical protein QM770_05130 [Tepidisphaeraceae bacterium]
MAEDFDAIVRQCKDRFGIRVHRWRASMSGCAWRSDYADGSSIRWVEAPYPRSPISLAVFLHEVGHHVIGLDAYPSRCEEELHAWDWALATMRELGIKPDRRVLRRYERSLRYEVERAMRLGVTPLPNELRRFAA